MQASRPRDVREIFQVSLGWYRRRFLPLMGISACFLLPYSIVSVYVRTHFTAMTSEQLQQIVSDVQNQGSAASSAAVLNAFPHGMEIWYSVLAFVYLFIVFPPYLGAVAHMVREKEDQKGKGLISAAGNAAFGRFWWNFGTIVLITVIYVVATVLYTLLLSVIMALLSSVQQSVADLIGVVGTLAFIVGVVWFLVRSAFVPITVTLEGVSFFRAIRTTFRVTRHQAGRLLGFYLTLILSMFVVQTLLTVILDIFIQSPGAQLFVSLLISLILTPFVLVCMSNMYQDVRNRQID